MSSTSTLSPGWVRRRAKLFEAGDYPDKGVVVTPEDLQALAGAFSEPVPVMIEHASSPLELGFLDEIEAEGAELFGTVRLTPEADALIARSGASSLSLGLSEDLSRIREVSLVRQPRVADARLFSGGLLPPQPLPHRPGNEPSRPHEGGAFGSRPHEGGALVARFVSEGKLVPAQAPYAQALLAREEIVAFGGEKTSVRDLVRELIERAPRHALFDQRAPTIPEDHSANLLMPEEAEFYRRYFPEVSLDAIARKRA